MKIFKSLSPLFFSFLVIFFLSTCMSHTKLGFNLLSDDLPDDAAKHFEKAKEHKVYASIAAQGLAEVDFEKMDRPTLDKLFTIKSQCTNAQKKYKKLPYRSKRKLKKRGGLPHNEFRKFDKKLQKKIFEIVKEVDRISGLDSFLTAYPKPTIKLRKPVKQLIDTIFVGKINSSADYVKWNKELKSKKLRPGLLLGAIEFVKKTDDLLVLDTFLQNFPLSSLKDTSVKAEFKIMRHDLVEKTIYFNSNYAKLTSLFQNHESMVFDVLFENNDVGKMEDLSDQLIRQFLTEYEFKEIGKFMSDHSTHQVTIDCWSEDLKIKAEKENVVELIRFLIQNKYSVNDGIVSSEIYKINVEKEISQNEQSKWSKEEREMFRWVIFENEHKFQLRTGHFSTTGIPDFIDYLKARAPAPIAYRQLVYTVSYFWDKKHWNVISNIISSVKNVFPDEIIDCDIQFAVYNRKQIWFKIVEDLMDRPAENISVAKFEGASLPFDWEANPVMAIDGQSFAHHISELYESNKSILSVKDYSNKWIKEHPINGSTPLSFIKDGKHIFAKMGKNKFAWFVKADDGWKSYDTLSAKVLKMFTHIGRASLSIDGKTLVFAASMDSLSLYKWVNTDLFVIHKKMSGKWSTPKPLKSLNSLTAESAPFLHADGKTLYFSSRDFNKSVGKTDVFVSYRLDDSWRKWSKPVNLGKEINSLDDNWGSQYCVDILGNAYFEGSTIFEKDILTTRVPKFARPDLVDVVSMDFNTSDKSKPRMNVEVKKANTSKVLLVRNSFPDNHTSFIMPDTTSLEVHITSASTFPVVVKIEPRSPLASEIVEIQIPIITLQSILEDSIPVPLQNGQFEFGKSDLSLILKSELDLIAKWLSKKPFLIEISGHTDDQGDLLKNQELSEERAEEVRNYFLVQGLPIDRLKFKGFGDTKPIAANTNETGRTMNRRIEIRLKKKKKNRKKSVITGTN